MVIFKIHIANMKLNLRKFRFGMFNFSSIENL